MAAIPSTGTDLGLDNILAQAKVDRYYLIVEALNGLLGEGGFLPVEVSDHYDPPTELRISLRQAELLAAALSSARAAHAGIAAVRELLAAGTPHSTYTAAEIERVLGESGK